MSYDSNPVDSQSESTPSPNSEPTLVHEVRPRPDPPADSPATDWESYFPFDEPYPDQRRAIEATREPLDEGGFVTAELACGTGKTLFALCRGIEMVRDPETDYERLLCLTSVKQQLRAFEDDLRSINGNLDTDAEIEPVSALTLVGKVDMCSLADAGAIDHERIYGRCEELREPVRNVIADTPAEDVPGRLAALVNRDRVDPLGSDQPLETDAWTSPYTNGRPTLGRSAATDSGDSNGPPSFCSFYAQYRRETWGDEEGGYSPVGVMTPDEIRADASADGLCPHAVMSDAIENAEVVVANYYHAFDPLTSQVLTAPIIDEQTLVVCDEAHMLVPRVRDLLSDSVSRWAVDRAIDEIESEVLEQSEKRVASTMRTTLNRNGVREADLERFVAFLAEAKDELERRALAALDEEHDSWYHEGHPDLPDSIEQPLRDPLTPQPDAFSQWAADNGYTEVLGDANRIGAAAAEAIQEATQMVAGYTRLDTYADSVGRVFGRWGECDHQQYFREIELEKRYRPDDRESLAWAEHYRASLTIQNCLPAEEIAAQFDHFGGGILMSATLAPLDVYRRTTGIDQLATEGRPIKEIIAGLPFPPEHRESCAVDLPKFTYKNRGSENARYRSADQDDLRSAYASVIREVVRSTDGNVLIAMPSYTLGEWAAEVVRSDPTIGKEVLVDESSSNDATEALKASFFAGRGTSPKVLTTSLRGTLTEGVDYDGDRLAACVSCGVPISSIGGPVPKAIKTAYEREFGKKNGFDYAFTVPAVRKSRQAMGRVIRGADEIGVRVLADRRWASSHQWDDVREYLPEYEREDYEPVATDELADRLEGFWQRRGRS